MSTPFQAPVCGFDIGSENCYIGVARKGGIEILLNDYSQRSTPAYVSLGDKQRELGVSAKQKHLMNISNTFYAMKRLVGRQYQDVAANENLPFPIHQSDSGEVAVKVYINDEEMTFTATQILAMLFTKLRNIAGGPVDCVVNCPNYFTDAQRRALRDAAAIAGLNVLRILPDMTAIGICYGFYRLNSSSEQSIIGFVNIGHTVSQCAIISFGPKQLMRILAMECDPDLGGKNFDEAIAEYFIKQHGLQLSKRSRLRLLAECEKLKKQLSANSCQLPINVECLQDERDFSARMDRTQFEEISAPYFERLESLFSRCLTSAQKQYQDICENNPKEKFIDFKLTSVEMTGGSCRVAAVKRLTKEVFGIEPSTTLNADEAVASGCALQCALLSPSFKVARDLQIIDYSPYQVNCKYWHESQGESKVYTVSPLFTRGDMMPFTRQIGAKCYSLPMIFEMEYVRDDHIQVIGQFKIDSREKLCITNNKMKVRVRLDNNGLVGINSAVISLTEKSKGEKKADIPVENNSMDTEESSKDATDASGESMDTNNDESEKKKVEKPKDLMVDLVVKTLWVKGRLAEDELQKKIEAELSLIMADRNWKERVDARNELEEYVYEWRDKIEEGRFDKFTPQDDKARFLDDLQSTQDWLYEDEESGSTQSRAAYADKLIALKNKYSNSIAFRVKESEERPSKLEQLNHALQMAMKLQDTKEQVEESKMTALSSGIAEKKKWLENCWATVASMPLNRDPVITVKSIQEQIDAIDRLTRPVSTEIEQKKWERMREAEKKAEEERRKAEAAAADATATPTPAAAAAGDEKSTGESQEASMEVENRWGC